MRGITPALAMAMFVLILPVSSCGARIGVEPPSMVTTPPTPGPSVTMAEMMEPVAWDAVKRAAGPSLVLRPTWVPDRFRGGPLLVEYAYLNGGDLRYRVGYRTAYGLITVAAGAVNSGPPTGQKTVSVRGLEALYSTTNTWPERQVTWTEGGVFYSVQARGVTEDEIIRIAGGLVPAL